MVSLRLLRMTPTQIAEALGARPDTISAILQEPDVAAELARAAENAIADAQEGLRQLARKAVEVYRRSLDSADERIALDAAKTLLTKAGADAPSKTDNKQQIATDGPVAVAIVVSSDDEFRAGANRRVEDK